MASDDRTDALLPSGRSDALDRLRAQLTEAQSRLVDARTADEAGAIAHWEAIIERIVARGRELPRGGTPRTRPDRCLSRPTCRRSSAGRCWGGEAAPATNNLVRADGGPDRAGRLAPR